MLMPIVSMNKMAMNESVATSCCYREEITANSITLQYVLHGGQIQPAYLDQSGFINDAVTSWTMLSYDILGWSSLSTLADNKLKMTYNDDGDKIWRVGANDLTLSEFKTQNNLYNGYNCSHDDAGCAYWSYEIVQIPNAHVGSTSKHTVINGDYSWDKPHPSVQFSS